MSGRRRPYDLATRASDYPARSGAPDRTVIVSTHLRCGSTLLGEALYFAGGWGCPLEYFHSGFRPPLAEAWNGPTLDSYVDALYRLRTDPSGTLSVKLFWHDLEDIVLESRPGEFSGLRDEQPSSMPAQTYRDIASCIYRILPNPVFISLSRRDLLRQAISQMIGAQTRLWRSIPGVGESQPIAESDYDYDRILSNMIFTQRCNAHWDAFFKANGLEPLRVSYEDLAAEYEGSVRKVFSFLGRPDAPLIAPRMRRQADARSEQMMARFLKDHRERTVR